MSYCRFGWDGSDVYVFTSSVGLECCGCILRKMKVVEDTAHPFGWYLSPVGRKVKTVFKSNTAMINHLLRHRKAGHMVPEYALERLREPEDAKENRRYWRGKK